MKLLSNLFERLAYANDSKSKEKLLTAFWQSSTDTGEKDLVLRLMLGQYPKRSITAKKIKDWTSEITGFQDWLIDRSTEEVGNSMHTFNLLLRTTNKSQAKKNLSDWLKDINSLKNELDVKSWLKEEINTVDGWQRLILLKLLTRTFKAPVTNGEVIRSLASYADLRPEVIYLRFFEIKKDHPGSLSSIFIPSSNEQANTPHTFPDLSEVKQINDIPWSPEWLVFGNKNGLEVQVTKYQNSIHLWSRQGELWTDKFPEIISAFSKLKTDFKLYGQLITNSSDIPIEYLTSRFNKKSITKNDIAKSPALFEVFEIIEGDLIPSSENGRSYISIARSLKHSSKDELYDIHKKCREFGYTGLIIKASNNLSYFNWKADRYSINAVLIYVEYGSEGYGGIRSLTFGARHEKVFLPVAKISVVGSNLDAQKIIQFVKENTLERFGPVRTIKPQLVYEIHFDDITRSTRRKSGFILNNPKIGRKMAPDLMCVHDMKYFKELLSSGKG